MKICVFGSGYVGLVIGACFADFGNHVVMVDSDAKKIEDLKQGKIPIFESGLEDLIVRNAQSGRLLFTQSPEEGLRETEIVFVAVSTPEGEDGRADLKAVERVAKTVGQFCLDSAKKVFFVLKSTVPVGTADLIRKILPSHVVVVNNPEFLKEGTAVADFLRPERVVLGAADSDAFTLMDDLYAPFVRSGAPILHMSNRSAEVAKYAANSFLAMKVSFINSLALFSEKVGADVYDVRSAMIADSRIGNKFLFPGAGYGGSCFPKDVLALGAIARDLGFSLPLVDATHEVNERQRMVVPERVLKFFEKRGLKTGTVALWGVAFKPETDDIREAPALVLIDELCKKGFSVRAFDPQGLRTLKRQRQSLIESGKLLLAKNADEALTGADVLAVMTEWNEFRLPDFSLIAKQLKLKAVFDGKNIYRSSKLEKFGLQHFGIGLKAFDPA